MRAIQLVENTPYYTDGTYVYYSMDNMNGHGEYLPSLNNKVLYVLRKNMNFEAGSTNFEKSINGKFETEIPTPRTIILDSKSKFLKDVYKLDMLKTVYFANRKVKIDNVKL